MVLIITPTDISVLLIRGVRFGENSDHYLVMAMQIGFISRKFDITKMQFGSQWVSGVGYDASQGSNETFLKPQVTSF